MEHSRNVIGVATTICPVPSIAWYSASERMEMMMMGKLLTLSLLVFLTSADTRSSRHKASKLSERISRIEQLLAENLMRDSGSGRFPLCCGN